MNTIVRCPWCEINDLERTYHDSEWGVPLASDTALFEFLILEGAQAGLSWDTVLKKRENYRAAFDHFAATKIVRYTPQRVEKLLLNEGIIRHRGKIESTILNARAFLAIVESHGSFARYIWQFVEGRPLQNQWRDMREVPASTALSDAMSKDLKKHGFKFVGSTICYAFMQATGMVNDHLVSCHRHVPVAKLGAKFRLP
jgi:DNA-3-methyladenine glycosylase I